jgi:hypothetical protein
MQHFMVLRIIEYQVKFWRAFQLEHPQAKFLPPVYSVVIHQSGKVWNVPTSLGGCFPEWAQLLHLPDVTSALSAAAFHLIDLAALPFDTLHEGVLANAAIAIMKLIDDAQPTRHLESVIDILDETQKANADHPLLQLLLRYAFLHAEKIDMPALRHHISRITNPQLTATVMTIAEQLITQGRQEGRHTAKRDALLLILRKRFGSISDQQRARINGADLDQLQLWTEAALDAASIDAVFAEK